MIRKPDIEAWKDLRFGMFIHWGLYALVGMGEWAMYNDPIDIDEYRSLMVRFTAENFDAAKWAKTAKAAGMKYMVLTTRHHDGFALWDSPSSYLQFDAMHSAAKRDFVREFVDAARAEELKVGFYYSPIDWRFPGFFFPRMYKKSADDLRTQTFAQIRELLTNYGKIDIFWFDGGEDYWLCHGRNLHNNSPSTIENPQCPGFWHAEELDEMIRTLQPGIVINNRYGAREFGDYLTPEGYVGSFNVKEPWETNITFNGSWGYIPDWPPRSFRESVTLLSQCATGDGNMLLNVGPKPDGTFPEDQTERLYEIGAWLDVVGESIYGTRGGPWKNDRCGGMTWRGNTLYVHVWEWKRNRIRLPKLGVKVTALRALTTDSLNWEESDGQIAFSVDTEARNMPVTVVRIDLDRPVDSCCADIEGLWQQS